MTALMDGLTAWVDHSTFPNANPYKVTEKVMKVVGDHHRKARPWLYSGVKGKQTATVIR